MELIQKYYQKIYRKMALKIAPLLDVKLDGKFLVIESDDWGSLRMPSLKSLEKLSNKGLNFFTEIGYDKFDTLESNSDIEVLLELFEKYHDSIGNPLVLTMNGVVANPDFEKIRNSAFTKYVFEPIDITYKKYEKCNQVLELLKEGIYNKNFCLQYHGREHLNVSLWMKLLEEGDENVLSAFESSVWSMKIDEKKYGRKHCLSAYDIDSEESCTFIIESIREGVEIFDRLYGYKPLSMIAPNYVWNEVIEKSAYESGIVFLQGIRFQRYPVYNKKNYTPMRYIGQRNHLGQMYLVRNCLWEPSQRAYLNSDFCFNQISQAFAKGHPAIISAHRLNFIGSLNENNRKENVKDFEKLIDMVLKTYPDVRFVSSAELGMIIQKINSRRNKI